MEVEIKSILTEDNSGMGYVTFSCSTAHDFGKKTYEVVYRPGIEYKMNRQQLPMDFIKLSLENQIRKDLEAGGHEVKEIGFACTHL